MHEQVQVGVVGASWYSELRHLPALKSHPRARTVAICGCDGDRVREKARKFDIPHVSQDCRELIDRGNGVLSEYGAHMIDLARRLVGDLSRVTAQLNMFLDRPGVDGGSLDPTNDSATLAIEFVTGTQGVIQLSSLSYLGKSDMDQRVVLHGEAGTLEVMCSFTSA